MRNEIIVPAISNSSIFIYISPKNVKEEKVCDWHFHNEIEIFCETKGKKLFYIGEDTIELKEGDIIFVNRKVPHKTKTFCDTSEIFIQFNSDYVFGEQTYEKLIFPYFSNTKDYVVFKSGSKINCELEEKLKKIRDEYLNKEHFYEMYIKSYVFEILACLYRHDIIKDPNRFVKMKDISKILPAVEFINQHYREQITLKDASGFLNVDKSHFCRLFKKATGSSFINYLNYVRITNAERLLVKTSKSVSEIAFETGFLSSSYFAETFKKENSITPSEYRKMILSSRI